MGGSPQFKNLSSFNLTAHHLKRGLQGHHDYLPQAGKGGKTWRVTHGRVYESGMDVAPALPTSFHSPELSHMAPLTAGGAGKCSLTVSPRRTGQRLGEEPASLCHAHTRTSGMLPHVRMVHPSLGHVVMKEKNLLYLKYSI